MTEKLHLNRLSVKRDIVFKRIFAHKGNEEFLTEFLSSLLNIKIKNIEIQLRNEFNIIERSTFYGSKLISDQLRKNDLYKDIKPVIVICILDYNFFPFEEYINDTVMVLNKHRKFNVNENMKYYYIELPKFRKSNYNRESIINQWLTFIDSENSKELEEIMKKNNTIKKANDELEYLEGDEAFKRKVELREKYERDLASALYNREEKGKLEGKLESKKEIAKKMIQKGMSLKEIKELTGLTEEELKNI